MLSSNQFSTTIYNPSKCYNGYTLFCQLYDRRVFLVDMKGRLVHYWDVPHIPGCHGVLLDNGNLLYEGKDLEGPLVEFGGSGGHLVELDWEGNEVWRYDDPFMNHDFWPMENGNVMVIRWEAVPDDLASQVKGGVPGTERKGVIWATSFNEIDREGNVVWEWSAYEHLDVEKDTICPLCMRAEWDHANGIQVLPDNNVMYTSRQQNCVNVVDRDTGKIIGQYGREEMAHPHNPSLVGDKTILVFDNGLHRSLTNLEYSRVLEIDMKTDEIIWQYKDDNTFKFYSPNISGCQRLPNGNTLICEGAKGRFFEVTRTGEIVWEYISPIFVGDPAFFSTLFGLTNAVFRCHRYAPDHPGLIDKDLDPKKYEWWNNVYANV